MARRRGRFSRGWQALILFIIFATTACGSVATPTTRPAGAAVGAPTAAPTASYPPPIPAGTTVTISFANYNLATAGLGKEATEELINGFMAANPNIKVEGRGISSNDIAAKIQAEVVAGNAPDVVQGVFSDLDFIVRDLRAVAVQDIVPPAEIAAWRGGEYPLSPNGLKLGELDGKIYGVPYTFSTPTLFYNATVFEAAGLDPNKPPTTWAEVKEYALQIKQRTGKEGVAIQCIGTFDWCWQGMVRSNGGRVLSEDRKTVSFADAPAVGAAEMWQDLVRSGAHPPLALADSSAAFGGGNLGMILTTSANQANFLNQSKGKFTLRAGKMPAFPGKAVVPTNSGSGLFILSQDPLKQRAAWELMKYITSEQGYTIITSKIGYLPLRTGIVNDDRYLKQYVAANPLVQPNLEQLQVLQPWVAWPGSNYRQAVDVMMKAVEEVIYGNAPAEATLKAAQERAQIAPTSLTLRTRHGKGMMMTTQHDLRLSRRTLLGGATGTALALLLAACGGPAAAGPAATATHAAGTAVPQNPAAAQASAAPATSATGSYPPPLPAGTSVTISFANYNLASAGIGKEATEQLLAEFMAANPQVKVEGRPLNSTELIAKVQADVVAGNPPNLVQGVFSDLDFIVNDLKAYAVEDLVPPTELAAYKGGEHPITPNGLKLGELNGKTYGVPYVFSTPTLFYNADIFTAAGLDPSKPPTTWAEAKAYALQIKQRAGKEGIFAPVGDWPYQSLVRSNGGRVLSEDRKTVMFGEPLAVGTAKMFQDLVQSGAYPKLSTAEITTSFGGGNLGMLLYTSALQASFLASSKGKWTLKTAKMPTFEGKPAVPVNSGSGLFILAKDPLKQRATWELMRFLTSERGYTIITSKIGYLPLRPSIVNDDRYLKQWVAENPLVQPNLEQLQMLEPWVAFPGPNYRQITDLMNKAVEDVVYNGANAETTLKTAQDRAQGLMPRR